MVTLHVALLSSFSPSATAAFAGEGCGAERCGSQDGDDGEV